MQKNKILRRCKKDRRRISIIHNPCSGWKMDIIYKNMINCVIMRNMIIEDKRDNNLEPFYKCWSIEAWIDFPNIHGKH